MDELLTVAVAEKISSDLLKAQGFQVMSPEREEDTGASIIRFSVPQGKSAIGSVTLPANCFNLKADEAETFLRSKVLEACRAAVKTPAAMGGHSGS